MKLFITGATGFIGNNITKSRLSSGDTITALVRPESNLSLLPETVSHYIYNGEYDQLYRFLEREKFDGIIHLAAHNKMEHVGSDISKFIESNIRIGTELIDAATKLEVPWFINTSSHAQHYEDQTYSAVNLYAVTKQAFEDVTKYYAETSNTIVVSLTLFDTFGSGDTRSKIIPLLIKTAQTGEELQLSPGEQILDISPIENVVSGYNTLIDLLNSPNGKKLTGSSFALTSKERLSLRDLVALFEKLSGQKLNINFGGRPYRDREIMIPWKDGTSIPVWKAPITLRQGLENVIQSELK